MKNKILPIFTLCLLLVFHSCERSEDFNHIYLQDHKLLRSYTSGNITTTMQLFQGIYPDISILSDNIQYGARIYSISYKTSFLGEEILASGLVSIPDTKGSFPTVSYQNGTNTCHSNAPSLNHNNTLYSLLNINAGQGYIIIMPDYIGFGESEEYLHPYYHTESSNRVIRDMILAVGEFTDYIEGLEVNGELYLLGYSQGGWATMEALKNIENQPLLGYELVAASCGAGAYDLIDFTHYVFSLDSFPNPFYFPYYIESRREYGLINDPLSLFFNEPYAGLIPGLFNGSLCNSELNANLPTGISDLFTEDILTGFDTADDFLEIRDNLVANSVVPWVVNTPLLITHSNGDKSVPIEQSINIYEDLIQAGTGEGKLEFYEISDLSHNDAIIPWGINSFIWFLN